MREHDFRFFVLSRSFDPSDRLFDRMLGPLGAVLGPVLGLLGLSWAVRGGRTRRAEGPEEARRASLELSGAMVGVSGLSRVLFRGPWSPFSDLHYAIFWCSSGVPLQS